MIPVAEIRALQAEWQLREDVIEKDYALGWLLTAIAGDPDLKGRWIFKGGTALRKCYFETYRFSEDLDFSLTADAPDEPEQRRRRRQFPPGSTCGPTRIRAGARRGS